MDWQNRPKSITYELTDVEPRTETSTLHQDSDEITLREGVVGSSKVNTPASSSGNSSKRSNENNLQREEKSSSESDNDEDIQITNAPLHDSQDNPIHSPHRVGSMQLGNNNDNDSVLTEGCNSEEVEIEDEISEYIDIEEIY